MTTSTKLKSKIIHREKVSLRIGKAAGQQRLAHNQVLACLLQQTDPNPDEMPALLEQWRQAEPQKWTAHPAVHQSGLTQAIANAQKSDPTSQAPFRSRKDPITLSIQDPEAIQITGRRGIYAADIKITLQDDLPQNAEINQINIQEDPESARNGRNRPLRRCTYTATIEIRQ